jgi:hypothetical protein
MPLSDASTTRAPWSAAHAKAAAMSHARPLPDASRARSGTMPAFGAPQVMSPLPWVPSVSARRAAHARSREAKREPGVLRKRRLDFVPREPPTPRLGDARLRPRKRERSAGVRDVCQRARVAWIPAVCASLLPFSRGCRTNLRECARLLSGGKEGADSGRQSSSPPGYLPVSGRSEHRRPIAAVTRPRAQNLCDGLSRMQERHRLRSRAGRRSQLVTRPERAWPQRRSRCPGVRCDAGPAGRATARVRARGREREEAHEHHRPARSSWPGCRRGQR